MPNIKSAEKRVSVINKKRLQNQMVRSQMNTAIKKFNSAISNDDKELARELLPIASARIDIAAKKGIIHKNSANHKKSQIGKALYQLEQGIIVIKIDAKTQKQVEQKAAAIKKAEEEKAIRAKRTENRLAKESSKAPKKDTKKDITPAKKDKVEKTEPKKTAVKKTPIQKPVEDVSPEVEPEEADEIK